MGHLCHQEVPLLDRAPKKSPKHNSIAGMTVMLVMTVTTTPMNAVRAGTPQGKEEEKGVGFMQWRESTGGKPCVMQDRSASFSAVDVHHFPANLEWKVALRGPGQALAPELDNREHCQSEKCDGDGTPRDQNVLPGLGEGLRGTRGQG
jgi:hypothetical protein